MTASKSAGWRLVAAAILLIAGVMRTWGLGEVPPGFQFDEAHNAIDAARFLDGVRPLFLADNGGREPFLTWLHAPMLAALGLGHPVLAMRAVSAFVGLSTVALTAVVMGRLSGDRGTGRFAAAMLAVTYWHVHFSRYAIRAILAPLWTTAAIGAWWMAVRPSPPDAHSGAIATRTRLAWAAACGMCLAGAVYSHPTGRILPFVLVAHAAYRLAGARANPLPARRAAVALAVSGVVSAALFAPLAAHFVQHPQHFTAHASDVSIAAVAAAAHDGSTLRALGAHALALAGMLSAAGDPSTFHNLPDLPVYDPIAALAATLGAGVLVGGALRGGRSARDSSVLLLAWLAAMLTPSLISDRPPNYSRAIAALPVIALLPALGCSWAAGRLRALRSRSTDAALSRRASVVPPLAAVALVAWSGTWTAWHHFVTFAGTPHVYYSYDVEKLDAWEFLRDASKRHAVFLAPLWSGHATLDYLNRFAPAGATVHRGSAASAGGSPTAQPRGAPIAPGGDAGGLMDGPLDGPISGPVFRALDARDSVAYLPGGRDTLVTAPATEERRNPSLDGLRDLLGPEAPAPEVQLDAQKAPLLVAQLAPRSLLGDLVPPKDAHLEPDIFVAARFGGMIELIGYSMTEPTPGEEVEVRLVWRALEPPDRNLTVFVHLVGADGQTYGQDDREPAHASFRTSAWEGGEVLVDRHRPLLDPAARGPVRLCVGWYDLATGHRLSFDGPEDAFCSRAVQVGETPSEAGSSTAIPAGGPQGGWSAWWARPV